MSGNAGKETVRTFIDAFNQLDSSVMADAFNFPHIRLAGGKFAIFASREDFVQRFDANTTALEAEGWHHTVIESLEVVHAVPDKVHLAVEYTRRHADDSVYSRFNSLWIGGIALPVNIRSATIRGMALDSSLNPLRWWKTSLISGVNITWGNRCRNGSVPGKAMWPKATRQGRIRWGNPCTVIGRLEIRRPVRSSERSCVTAGNLLVP